MQSNTFFIIPLTVAYGTICGLWFLLSGTSLSWPIPPIQNPSKRWVDLGIAMVASIGILALGQLYSAGYFLSQTNNAILNLFIWPLNNVLIFSPIFLALVIRKQGPNTIFISRQALPKKLLFGISSSFVGIAMFLFANITIP